MSNIHIALVAEGPLDRIVIEAALSAIVTCPFVLTVLQPEATKPKMGTGWSGVVKWCAATSERHAGTLDTDPTLLNFDVIIIHLDADVADKQYLDCGQEIANLAVLNSWHMLPCSMLCPPSVNSFFKLKNVIASWLGKATVGTKTVICIPSKSLGSWLAAAVLPAGHPLLVNLEFDANLENKMAVLPLAKRVKKSQSDFRKHQATITKNWASVKAMSEQAEIFHSNVLALTAPICAQQTS